MIIREEDKMIFSAKKMQIYKFNDKGFNVVNFINNNERVSIDSLLEALKEDYTEDELQSIVNKMIDNNIIVEYEEA